MEDWGSPVLARLIEARPEAIASTHARLGDATAVVERDRIVEVARLLRDDPELDFDMLSDLTAVDYLENAREKSENARKKNENAREKVDEEARGGIVTIDRSSPRRTDDATSAWRFEVVYHFYSIGQGHRLRVKVRLSERDCELDSLCELWPAANWMEREVYDLYGIHFRHHPILTRILLYDEFEGHPLRKDYPKTKRQPLIGPDN